MFKTRRIPTTRAAPLIGGLRSAALFAASRVHARGLRTLKEELPYVTIWYMYDGLMLS